MLNVELPVLVRVTAKVSLLPNLFSEKCKVAGMSLTVPGVRVMVAVPSLDVSVTDVAVMVTLGFAGTVAGAEYIVGVPLAVLVGATVPHAGEHGVVPCVRVQLTPWLLVSLLTMGVNGVAFNCGLAFTGMIALVGETETAMASTVICTEPCCEVSESEVATIVTGKSLAGGVVGAV